MALNYGSFAGCCGLNILSGFPNQSNGTSSREPNRKFLEDYKNKNIISVGGFPQNAILVLNGDQNIVMKSSLEENGFRCIHRFVNHNYQDVLYLWFFDADPERSPGHPEFNSDKYEEFVDKNQQKLDYVRLKVSK